MDPTSPFACSTTRSYSPCHVMYPSVAIPASTFIDSSATVILGFLEAAQCITQVGGVGTPPSAPSDTSIPSLSPSDSDTSTPSFFPSKFPTGSPSLSPTRTPQPTFDPTWSDVLCSNFDQNGDCLSCACDSVLSEGFCRPPTCWAGETIPEMTCTHITNDGSRCENNPLCPCHRKHFCEENNAITGIYDGRGGAMNCAVFSGSGSISSQSDGNLWVRFDCIHDTITFCYVVTAFFLPETLKITGDSFPPRVRLRRRLLCERQLLQFPFGWKWFNDGPSGNG